VDLLGQADPMPRLVVLNSCSGATTGTGDLFSGTAAALVRGGISAVAAMQYEISDSAAVAFARGFYTALARGRGIDKALSSGRVAILGTSDTTLEWVTPVLYLRGDRTHLYALAPAPSPQQPSTPGPAPAPVLPSDLTVCDPTVCVDPGGGHHAAATFDFFVSYTQADKAWAEWIAWELEEHGERVLIQAWDFVPGSN
jgi:hypothetical protein